MRPFFFSLLFLFLSAIAFAEDPDSVQPPDYSVTVTADRLEQPRTDTTDDVDIITAEEIDQRQDVTVSDALRDVAGLQVVQSGSIGKTTSVFLRGANSTQTMVLIDGVEINNPFFGGVEFSDFLTSGVERIEVLKGPQSTLYGSDAMAGVINIISGSGLGKTSGGGFFEAGGMDTFREGFQIGGKSGKADYHGSLSRYDTQGQFDNDEFSDLQANSRFGYAFNERSALRVNASYYDSHIGIPFNGVIPTPDRNQDSKLGVIGLGYDYQTSSYLNLKIFGSYVRRDFHFEDPFDFSPVSENNSNSYKITLQNDAFLGSRNILTTGYEQESQDVVASDLTGEFLNDTVDSRSVFAQNKWNAGPFLIAFGGRYDHHNSFGDHFSPRVSGAYQINAEWKVRASAGTAFRAPSVGELTYPFYGNPDLKPETSKSYEAGLDWTQSVATLSFTGFHSSYKDLITFDPVTFIAANIDRAKVTGLEVSADIRPGKSWSLQTTYAFVDTEDETTGDPLFRRPKNSGSITLNYSQLRWGWNANFSIIGRRFETDFETFENRYNPGYTKADLAAFFRFGNHIKLTGRIENFLDRQYEEAFGFPAPGITAYGGIHFEL